MYGLTQHVLAPERCNKANTRLKIYLLVGMTLVSVVSYLFHIAILVMISLELS